MSKARHSETALQNERDWKRLARPTDEGYFTLQTADIPSGVVVRLFLTRALLTGAEDTLYRQIVNAARFPGARLVAITPDVHYGYGVPVGCVLLTDVEQGAVAMGPVGYDIGCFTGDTLVPLLDGHARTLRELAEQGGEHWVFALTPDHRVVAAKGAAHLTRHNAALLRVKLDNGLEVVCTPDHQFMLRDGTWCEASQLTSGTSLMPLYRREARGGYQVVKHPATGSWQTVNHKVVSVEPLDRTDDVYCMTVPQYGNFALDAGVFVHNCGMVSARSNVPVDEATPAKRLAFNKAVMERVQMGVGGRRQRHRVGKLTREEFESLVRGGAEHYIERYGAGFDRTRAERDRIPVDDGWQIPYAGRGRPERGIEQLGSLGGGNHFIELQRCEQTETLFVQVHTGSRGFGHGLATNYFELARAERPADIKHIDLGYFLPESQHYRDYLNAVAAGGNFAILNRLIIFEQIAAAFHQVFHADLELVYEISHNLVQRETHPEFGEVWVHRKGATRAFPPGHPTLAGTLWEQEGHPILIPGSNKDYSYILRPLPGAVRSGYSVNHGAGRRLSRGEARRRLSQEQIDRQYRAAGILVNAGGHVPLDESAPAYKSSREVIDAVVGAGLARVEYELWPLSSLKGTD